MKSTYTLILLLIMVLLLYCPAACAGGEETVSSPEEAEALVRALFEDASSLDGRYLLTPAMETALARMGGFSGLKAQLAALGTPTEIGPAYEGTLQGMKAYFVPCCFALMPLDLALAMAGDALAGLTTQPFTGDRETEEDAPFTSAALTVSGPGGELPGTYLLPEGEGPFPAVVFVHGSGPSDRDETLGSLTPFRDIAEGLARRGIASLRYDKRTLVYPEETASDLSFTLMEETVLDALSAVQTLAAEAGVDPERIFVLGHSLGASAIPAIDSEAEGAAVQPRGYLLLAPGMRRLDVMMREQYLFLSGLMPGMREEADAALRELDKLSDPDALKEDEPVAGAYPAYWRWLFSYDIPAAAARIARPSLVIWGEEDYQVTPADLSLLKDAVGDRENWTFTTFPGLTHMFVPGKKADGPAAYARDARVDEGVIDAAADFILAH